ncbi:HNH endonuclease family protein [Nocardioides sp. GXZ039]|uniref:HNH endonuclease family protein n=1 Tax=Nocardioides sp. GXZ039 TaxID=3136018 RepID=UPI0030F3F8CC
MRRRLLSLFGAALGAGAMLFAHPVPAHAERYSAPVGQAVDSIPVAAERRTGYDRDLFRHWIDADGDGCDTRDEVLISEADDPVRVGSGCSLSGGRWYSYYEGGSQTSSSALDIDHMVPLAEAWDSGARSWTSARRQAYANDLGDSRSLVAVTAAQNRAKGDQDVAEWLPPRQRCRYLVEFVAVKIRWGLSVDSAERTAMRSLAAGCSGRVVTVTTVG